MCSCGCCVTSTSSSSCKADAGGRQTGALPSDKTGSEVNVCAAATMSEPSISNSWMDFINLPKLTSSRDGTGAAAAGTAWGGSVAHHHHHQQRCRPPLAEAATGASTTTTSSSLQPKWTSTAAEADQRSSDQQQQRRCARLPNNIDFFGSYLQQWEVRNKYQL